MKKVTLFPFLLSLSPVLIIFMFTLTSWRSANSGNNPETGIKIENSINNPDTSGNHAEISEVPAAKIETTSSVSYNSLPIDIPAETVASLENLHDQDLQSKLDAILHSNSHWVQLSKNKTLSIGIVDMNDPMHSKFAAINENNMVYAASLPKIAILLASEEAIQNGTLKETPEVKQDMRLMIAKSNNQAASRMANRVGIKQIGEVLQSPRYNLYDPQHGGGLWVGKAYGGGSIRIGDPIKNLSHAASVMQVCKYYYMLAFGQLVNKERSSDMLDMLVNPELHHKFVSVLDRVAPNAKVYRKSGTWDNWHADSAMVWDNDRHYIVVVLAEDPSGETMLRELMLKIDTALVSKG
jgi:beta-lactamase class A